MTTSTRPPSRTWHKSTGEPGASKRCTPGSEGGCPEKARYIRDLAGQPTLRAASAPDRIQRASAYSAIGGEAPPFPVTRRNLHCVALDVRYPPERRDARDGTVGRARGSG